MTHVQRTDNRAHQRRLDRAIAEGKLPAVDAGRIELDRPKRKEHGDWATNLALAVAGKVEMNPRQVAEAIKDSLPRRPT